MRVPTKVLVAVLACLIPWWSGTAVAVNEREVAKAFVDGAASFLNTAGREKGLAELNRKDGKFVKGELYVFAYDVTGTMVAHPINPKLVGKNLLEVPDVDGKFFRKEIVEVAKSKGSGWVDYKYKNPDSGKVESKTTYLKMAGDVIVCCGVYK